MSTDEDAGALIYNEDHSILVELPVSEDVIDFMDGEPKKYFRGYLGKDMQIRIVEEAHWQQW